MPEDRGANRCQDHEGDDDRGEPMGQPQLGGEVQHLNLLWVRESEEIARKSCPKGVSEFCCLFATEPDFDSKERVFEVVLLPIDNRLGRWPLL